MRSIGGIRQGTSNPIMTLPADVRDYPDAVAQALSQLRLVGVNGPYKVLLGADAYTALAETRDHGYPVLEHVKRLVNDEIIWAPAIVGAFVLTTRGGDFELTIGQDTSIGYSSHTDTAVRLYLQETFHLPTPDDRGGRRVGASRRSAARLKRFMRQSGTFRLGSRTVKRLGYGAMQLAGPGVFGPPKDRETALAVLREARASGVDHIDTADFYGPHVTNQIIREALAPYRDDLVIVTKVGARRGADGSWNPAFSRAELIQAVHDNLRNLGLETLDVVNLRALFDVHHPSGGSLEEPLSVLTDLQREGLVRHIGLSNVTAAQIAAARRTCEIVCVQNHYNLTHRTDDPMIDNLAREGIAYVPFFPLGGFTPLQSSTLSNVASRLGATPMQVALAWLLHRAPNILLIPGTSSIAHLHQNLAAGQLTLSPQTLAELDAIAG